MSPRPARDEKSPPKDKRALLGSATAGFTLAVLGAVTANELNLLVLLKQMSPHRIYIYLAIGGAVLGMTRLRGLLWLAAASVALLYMVVAYTPFVDARAHAWVRSDPLRPCPAVVMLSADVFADGSLNSSGHDRLMRALELLKGGYADRLVVTHVASRRSGMPTVRRRMEMMELNVPVHEVGPVRVTRDEALQVAELARREGWDSILLVTDPLHTRRAGAVFEKAGLKVVVRPATETEYDFDEMTFSGNRVPAFRDWIKEVVGWYVYRRRGWL